MQRLDELVEVGAAMAALRCPHLFQPSYLNQPGSAEPAWLSRNNSQPLTESASQTNEQNSNNGQC